MYVRVKKPKLPKKKLLAEYKVNSVSFSPIVHAKDF
jgi:hypothetical protein